MTEARTIKNMYKYVGKRMMERLNRVSFILLDYLNKVEMVNSTVQEAGDEIRKLMLDLEEDFKIIHKLEKKVEDHKE